jgi:alkylation response protein AidB-like acyl-CoA dehydrogenase
MRAIGGIFLSLTSQLTQLIRGKSTTASDLNTAAWFAGDTCVQTFGGYGFAAEYDVERKFRETRLYQVAPISTNLILSHIATHVLGMPKSF